MFLLDRYLKDFNGGLPRFTVAIRGYLIQEDIPQAHYITDFMDDDSAVSGLRGQCMRALVAAIELLHVLQTEGTPHLRPMSLQTTERMDIKADEPLVPIQHLTLNDLRAGQNNFPVKDCHRLEKIVHVALRDLAQAAQPPQPNDGWEYIKTSGLVQIFIKENAGSGIAHVKGVALIPASPIAITHVLKNPKQRGLYDVFMEDATVLELIDDNTRVTRTSFKAGKMLATTRREVVLLEHRHVTDDGTFNLVSTSIGHMYPVRASKTVRAQVNLAGFCIEPVREANWRHALDLQPACSLGHMDADESSSDDDFAEFAAAMPIAQDADPELLGAPRDPRGLRPSKSMEDVSRGGSKSVVQSTRKLSRDRSSTMRRGNSERSLSGDESSGSSFRTPRARAGRSGAGRSLSGLSFRNLLSGGKKSARKDDLSPRPETDWAELEKRFANQDVPLSKVTFVLQTDLKGNIPTWAKNQVNRRKPLMLNTIAKLAIARTNARSRRLNSQPHSRSDSNDWSR